MTPYEERIAKLGQGIFETSVCEECGKESTLYFGFASPCRHNGGSHQQIKPIPSTRQHEHNKLRAAYSTVMWYDRASFEKYAPQCVKDILKAE